MSDPLNPQQSPENAESPASSSAVLRPISSEFGLPMATFVVISSMVGVGVLTTSGFTVASTGSNQLMLWLWLIGGLVALCGALTVAEVAASLPASGGDYVFLYEAYGPLAAFLSGWVSFLIGFAAPIAASAFAASSYILSPWKTPGDSSRLTHQCLASVLILIFAVIHSSNRRRASWTHVAVTILKLAVLGALLFGGLAAGWRGFGNLADRPTMTTDVIVAMMFSSVYISYAYTGWNAAAYLSGEIGDPGKRLPQSILLGTLSVILLYLGLNLVYAFALPAAEIREIVKNQGFDAVAPIAELAAVRLFGPKIAAPLSVAVGFAVIASMSAYILTGPRVLYAMAKAGHFPAIAGRLSPHSRTPAIATVLQVSWALVLLWTGSFENIVIYAGVGLALFSMLSVSSVYMLRWKRPELHRPFLTPGYPFVPAIFLLATSALTAAAFWERSRVSLYSLLSILAGIPVYYVWHWLSPRHAESRVA